MEIYVDKLPKNCGTTVCEFSRYENARTFYCSILNLNLDTYHQNSKRNPLCPLKQLTNAQLAIGWYQEGKDVHSKICGISLSHSTSIATLVSPIKDMNWYIKEKPQYTLTDWKGAREAVKARKKVTFESTRAGTLSLEMRPDFTKYWLEDKDGNYCDLSDVHYDSTEWKVWEN